MELEGFSEISSEIDDNNVKMMRKKMVERRMSVKFSNQIVENNAENKKTDNNEDSNLSADSFDKNYSSGESSDDGQFVIKYSHLPEPDKQRRMLWLWERAYKKAKGASIIIRKQIYQNNKIYVDGYWNRNNVNYI